jgi:effector-binding domain-containing protein
MSNQVIDYLRTTFTSAAQPVFSSNASGIDTVVVERKQFINFVEEQEKTFMCSFIERTTQGNGRKEKNSNYLSAVKIPVQVRDVNSTGGRPSPLFIAVRGNNLLQ